MHKNYKYQIQNKIIDFIDERNWGGDRYLSVYNMLCNICEENGELWNVFKWMKNDKDLAKIEKMKRVEIIDGIGDIFWCVARLANSLDIDIKDAVNATHAEYEDRFPPKIVRMKHGNPSLGGYDGKYEPKQ